MGSPDNSGEAEGGGTNSGVNGEAGGEGEVGETLAGDTEDSEGVRNAHQIARIAAIALKAAPIVIQVDRVWGLVRSLGVMSLVLESLTTKLNLLTQPMKLSTDPFNEK